MSKQVFIEYRKQHKVGRSTLAFGFEHWGQFKDDGCPTPEGARLFINVQIGHRFFPKKIGHPKQAGGSLTSFKAATIFEGYE